MFCFILIIYVHGRIVIEDLENMKKRDNTTIPDGFCRNYDSLTQYGQLPVAHGSVSFVYYTNKNKNLTNIVYINGGPGMSSQVSNFLEIGPYNGRWNEFSNILFLDLPAGTGYGVTNATQLSYEDVAQEYIDSMKQFNTLCNLQFSDVILFSTDFGARFALTIAKFAKGIKGIALLDPFLDTQTIMAEIPNYAFHLSVIDYQERQYFEKAIIQFSDRIDSGQYGQENGKFLVDLYKAGGNMSLYNILQQTLYSEDEDKLEASLNDKSSHQYINFETQFVARSYDVFQLFKQEFFKPFGNEIIEELLLHMDVLVYQSQFDMLIPPSATMKWLTSINYELSEFFYQNKLTRIKKDDQLVGLLKRGGHLEYIFVLESGQVMHRDSCNISTSIIKQYLESII